MLKVSLAGKLLPLLLVVAIAACTPTPNQEKVREALKPILPAGFKVVAVRELKEVPGLVEVVLETQQRPVVIYLDKKAKYVFSGSLLALDTKTNLTAQTLKKYLPK